MCPVDRRSTWSIIGGDQTPILTVVNHRIITVVACGAQCVLPRFVGREADPISLGSTRPTTPGMRVDDELVVTNVFTDSRRSWWLPIRRSWEQYSEVITRLDDHPLHGVVKVREICRCSTVMDFLDEHALLDNMSRFTPAQHKNQCWSDSHTVEEFAVLAQQILTAVHALHDLGIIHTDITGFNVLVNSQNEPTVVDLFSCVPVTNIGPSWLSASWKQKLGLEIEERQIKQYLFRPAEQRWGKSFVFDARTYTLSLGSR